MKRKRAVGAERRPPHDAYPVRTVARLTGLSPDLIRAWEKRYGVVAPVRGPRGARLYRADEVAHLRLLAALVSRGRAIGDIARLDRASLQAMVAETETSAAVGKAAAASGAGEQVIANALEALARFDELELERLLGEALVGMGSATFLRQVAIPFLEIIGSRWSEGRLSIAEEHLVSGMLRSLFSSLNRVRPQQRTTAILLATPSGERHELGLMIVALMFLEAGLGVCYLGADSPAEEIARAAASTAVLAVGLSVVHRRNRERSVQELKRLERSLSKDVELWLGGADASAVASALGRSRALVVQRPEDVEAQIRRLRELSATRT
jgi:methanogenic corrinoid protein MtbC1